MIKYLVLEDEMLRIRKSCTKKISLHLQINLFFPPKLFHLPWINFILSSN